MLFHVHFFNPPLNSIYLNLLRQTMIGGTPIPIIKQQKPKPDHVTKRMNKEVISRKLRVSDQTQPHQAEPVSLQVQQKHMTQKKRDDIKLNIRRPFFFLSTIGF